MITIKLCKSNESKIISELSNVIWHECYKDMLSLQQRVYMLEKFLNKDYISSQINNGMIYYLVYLNNELTGYFAYTKNSDHIYLEKLYIKDIYRGNGIFTYILNHINNYKLNIKLNTCKYNPTLKIYLHVGFEIISERVHDIGNNFVMDDYILEKKYK